MTTPNEELIERLRALGRGPCIFWEAADLLQSQAERIKEQARLLEGSVPMDDHIVAIVERDTLRAQLAAIAATEPVGYIDEMDKPRLTKDKRLIALSVTGGCEALFTRPMPAQDVTELVDAFEYHIEQTRPIERSTVALSKYKGAK